MAAETVKAATAEVKPSSSTKIGKSACVVYRPEKMAMPTNSMASVARVVLFMRGF